MMDKAAQDPKGEAHYLDSMQNEKVYLGSYTLKQCREMEIGLGLSLIHIFPIGGNFDITLIHTDRIGFG